MRTVPSLLEAPSPSPAARPPASGAAGENAGRSGKAPEEGGSDSEEDDVNLAGPLDEDLEAGSLQREKSPRASNQDVVDRGRRRGAGCQAKKAQTQQEGQGDLSGAAAQREYERAHFGTR